MNLNEENREERKFTGLPSETRHNLIQNLIHNLFKSPWEGGMYERLIKDVKKTLHKTLDWTQVNGQPTKKKWLGVGGREREKEAERRESER